ncbi:MAG: hypothetical protein VB934_06035, partial [Polyangiaceae bacterium]
VLSRRTNHGQIVTWRRRASKLVVVRILRSAVLLLATVVVTYGCSDESTQSSAAGGADAGGAGGSGGGQVGGAGPCITGSGGGTVRVASWNIGAVGAPGTPQHEAALAVLLRIGADVVGVNEVNGSAEKGYFGNLAFDAGYDNTLVSDAVSPFGTQRNGFMSKLPIVDEGLHSAAGLSGDAAANDITRLIPELTVDVNGCPLTVVVNHWKAGFNRTQVFRRAVESFRVGQVVAARDGTTQPLVFPGDVNDEIDAIPVTPVPFFDVPMAVPPGYVVGADIQALLDSRDGIYNDAFTLLLSEPPGVTAVDALQLDGDDATKPDSGRRLDYVFVSAALAKGTPSGEVYDSADEGRAGGLPKIGSALSADTSLAASDHLLVFADLTVPACECTEANGSR